VSHADDIAALMPLCDSIHCAHPSHAVWDVVLHGDYPPEATLRLKLCELHSSALVAAEGRPIVRRLL
jgi:hypothetical protein